MVIVEAERMVAGGDGLARDAEGRIVFVPGVLPGERVDVTITSSKKGVTRATIDEVLIESPDRVEPPCERRRQGCGGCDWQHLVVAEQLPAKVAVVRDAFRRIGKLPDATIVGGSSVPATGYRTSIRIVGDEYGRASYRRFESNETVPASGCLVADPNLEHVLDGLRLTPGLELSLRRSDATGAITATFNPARGEVDGLPAEIHVGRRSYLTEVVQGHRFKVSSPSFFQSGPDAAELLVDAVRRAAPELATAERVLDAYGGVGLFAVAATTEPTHVVVVESSRSAVADARVNLTGRSHDVIHREFSQWRPARGQRFDVAIADPARSGLAKPGVSAILRADAPVIVLVSCDPVSAARDSRLLIDTGYRHASTEVVDVFPHTHHVETITRLHR